MPKQSVVQNNNYKYLIILHHANKQRAESADENLCSANVLANQPANNYILNSQMVNNDNICICEHCLVHFAWHNPLFARRVRFISHCVLL